MINDLERKQKEVKKEESFSVCLLQLSLDKYHLWDDNKMIYGMKEGQ